MNARIRKISDLPDTVRMPEQDNSSLHKETLVMNDDQRNLEQQGHRNHWQVRVIQKERNLQEPGDLDYGEDMGMSNQGVKQHPLLNNQSLDGMPDDMPAPTSPELRDKYNEKKEQQKNELIQRLELANKLAPGNAPSFNPKPGMP